MAFLFDLFPVILFFVAYQMADIYAATGVAMAASVAQIGWLLIRKKTVKPMMWVSFVLIVIFGGATIILHNKLFIMWKPTVLYWLFASVLIGGKIFFRRNFIRTLMEEQMSVPERVWSLLNLSWAGFFLSIGLLNLYVAYNFSEPDWVKFKTLITPALMFVFVLCQGLWLSKHIEQKEESQ